jgi:hypothetical protein
MNAHKLHQFEILLCNALSPDNVIRRQAEQTVELYLNENRETCVLALIGLLRASSELQVRALSAIILRRRLPCGEPVMFNKLSTKLRERIKADLLTGIAQEPERYVRSQVCDTAAALAEVLLYNNRWEQLIPFLYECSRADETGQRFSALTIFSKLCDRCPPETVLTPHIELIHAFYGACLADPIEAISSLAVTSVCQAVINFDENLREQHTPPFQELTPRMFQVLSTMLSNVQHSDDDRSLLDVLGAIADLCTEEPTFFRPHLEALSNAMGIIGETRELPDGVRQIALECFVLVVEEAPGMARRCSPLIERAVRLALSLMLEVDEDPEWVSQPEDPDLFDNSNFGCGEMALDRLAQAIRGKKLGPMVMPLISDFVSRTDWKFRHAGLYALGQVGEMLPFDSIPFADIARFLGDPNARVRYAALHCLGQLAGDFQPRLSNEYHGLLIPALTERLGETSHPRIQTHAAAALFNVVDQWQEDLLAPYLDPLLERLVVLLEVGSPAVQGSVVTLVAALAGTAPLAFERWYGRVVPLMKRMIAEGKSSENDGQWKNFGKAMDALSFVGTNVAPDLFREDARDIMRGFLIALTEGSLAADDMREQHIMQALPRMCEVLHEEFLVFMPVLMPVLLARASKEEDWGLLSSQADEDATAASERWQSRGLTSALEEKMHAVSVLACFCHELQGFFMPYLAPTLELMLPLTRFFLREDVRYTAIQSIPAMVKCAMQAADAGEADVSVVKTVFGQAVQTLLKGFDNEPDVDMLLVLVEALQNSVDEAETLATECLDQAFLTEVGQKLLSMLQRSADRVALRLERLGPDDDEECVELMEAQNATEDQLLVNVSECVASLMRASGEAFIPTFALMLPEIKGMLRPERSLDCKKIAIFMFDDFLAYAMNHATPFVPDFVPALLTYVNEPGSAELRQAVPILINRITQMTHAPK